MPFVTPTVTSRRLLFPLLSILLICGYSSPALANLLVNPDFETTVLPSDGSGWERRGGSVTLTSVTTPVVSGSKALLITNREQNWNGLQQDVLGLLSVGKNYRIVGNVRLADGEQGTDIQIQLIVEDDSGTSYPRLALVSANSAEYTHFDVEFSFSGSNISSLKLAVNSPNGESLSSFIVDGFMLVDPDLPPDRYSLSPGSFAFRSSGSADAGGWLLEGPGYIGTFVHNFSSEDKAVELELDLMGVDYSGESPVIEVFTGVSREERTVSAGSSTETFTYMLPPGKHTLRIGFLNPASGNQRSLTINNATLTGFEVIFDNVATNALEAAQNAIEYYRKKPFTLILHDEDGQRLAPGTVLTMDPVTTDFNFGVGVKGWNSGSGTADRRDWVDPTHPDYASLQPIRDFLTANFNTIVTNNAGKWSPVERNRDVLDYGVLDLIQGFAETNGLRLRLHALAWAKSGGSPPWVMDLLEAGLAGDSTAKADLRSEISERIIDYTTGRAQNWIEVDGINESWHVDGLLQLYGHEGIAEIFVEAYEALRATGSAARIYFNEYGTFRPEGDVYASWYLNHIHDALVPVSNAIRSDGFGVGHQSYMSPDPSSGTFFDPVNYYQVLQNTASLGLPLSITEFGIKQEPAPAPSYMASAELLRDAMTIALGNDRVNSFIVWNFLEGEMFRQATAAPMLEDDGNFNYTLTDFGRAWQHMTGRVDHSALFPDYPVFAGTKELTVGENGSVDFHGLKGRYRLEGDDFSYEVDLDLAGDYMVNGPPVRNVLMIVVDDLKPTIGAFGDPIAVTPNLDRLADEGVIFTNAHCQMAICGPSRASVLTGLRPDSTGVFDLNTRVRDVHPEVITLPQHFSNFGYTTHGISKLFHGTNASGQDVALSWNDGWQSHGVTKKFHEPGKSELEDSLRNGGFNSQAGKVSSTDRGKVSSDLEYGDGMAAEMGVTKIAEYASTFNESGQPFFLAVGFQKPHLPFNAPDSYWALYDDIDFGMASYDAVFDRPEGAPDFARPYSGEPGSYEVQNQTPNETYGNGWPEGDEGVRIAPNAAEAKRLVHGYYACTSFIDHQVGRLLDELEAQGISDDTIVVLWSDHGFHLGDHGAFWSKHTNYEQATRSVLMVKSPDVTKAGGVVVAPVELVDIYPTLCQLAGLPYPSQPEVGPLEGSGLEPVLRDPSRPWRKAAFSQYHRRTGDLYMGYSMRTDRYRLTSWFPRGNLADAGTTGSSPIAEEFYDYELAPAEPMNLLEYPEYSETIAALRPVMEGERWEDPLVSQTVIDPDYMTSIDEWKAAYFPLGSNLKATSDREDFDQDGLSNAVEYFLGLSPVAPDPSPFGVSRAELNGGSVRLSLSYPIPPERSDYQGFVEHSPDLETWSSGGLETLIDTESKQVEVRYDSLDPRSFLRFVVKP